jgi:hypothetical protein
MWECGISHLSEICTTASWPWLCQHEGMVSELSLHCQRIAQAEPIGGTAPNQVAMATNPRRLIPQSHIWECGISHLWEICTTTSWPWPLIRLELYADPGRARFILHGDQSRHSQPSARPSHPDRRATASRSRRSHDASFLIAWCVADAREAE